MIGQTPSSMTANIEKAKQMSISKRELLKRELPHLFGHKMYRWQRAFFETRNRMAILTAANQIGKSTIQIRKVIHWATAQHLWPELWPTHPTPREFWYLYPSYQVATNEFQNKWVPEFLPKRGNFIGKIGEEECIDPVYGWKAYYDKKFISRVDFASGVRLYFKAYTQNVHNLQAGSVHYIGCDEELLEELYSELKMRTAAVNGYFSMVFTATRNQLLWHMAMEGKGELEKFPNAFKLQVSMYDCMYYADGTKGVYSEEKIAEEKESCKSQTEIDRRILGRFISEEGRKYPTFDPSKHYVKPFTIPKDWILYGGVDPGSGGSSHPAAMGIIAVRPDYRYGCVIAGWRGDGIETTSGDILDQYRVMKDSVGRHVTLQAYDYAAKDFSLVATRYGEPFVKAEKSHDQGEDVVNTLFKSNALGIFDTPELRKLGVELLTLRKDTAKRHAKDDLIDGALRYPSMIIPWDFTYLKGVKSDFSLKKERIEADRPPMTEAEYLAEEIRQRRGESRQSFHDGWEDTYNEVNEWNGLYGN